MQIYLEDALVENFCVDTALLYLSLVASKQTVSVWRLLLAGAVGAIFAVLFPLLVLPTPLAYVWKMSMGILLCLLAVKGKKSRGGIWLTTLLFYAFSFCFGGALVAVFELFSLDYQLAEGGGVVTKIPVGVLLFFAVFFVALVRLGVSWVYRKRKEYACVYACELTVNGRTVRVNGFLDTGNTASYQGSGVHFLSVEIFHDLFDSVDFSPVSHLTLHTLFCEKSVKVYRVERMKMWVGRREITILDTYVSPTTKLIGRAYQMLISAAVLETIEREK